MLLEVVIQRLRPAGELDRLLALSLRQITIETEPVPKLLGDEWHEGMKQAQGVAEDKVDHRQRVRFPRRAAISGERTRLACR